MTEKTDRFDSDGARNGIKLLESAIETMEFSPPEGRQLFQERAAHALTTICDAIGANPPMPSHADAAHGEALRPAGMPTDVWRSVRVTACAKAAHEANRFYCEAIGDLSQVPWNQAPEWQTSSAINGVEGVLRGANAGASHLSWQLEKIAAGWKYGPVKDPVAKTHPCLVHFTELPPAQQAKDHLFVATVHAMAMALGLTVTP
jgi:RyR domain